MIPYCPCHKLRDMVAYRYKSRNSSYSAVTVAWHILYCISHKCTYWNDPAKRCTFAFLDDNHIYRPVSYYFI